MHYLLYFLSKLLSLNMEKKTFLSRKLKRRKEKQKKGKELKNKCCWVLWIAWVFGYM